MLPLLPITSRFSFMLIRYYADIAAISAAMPMPCHFRHATYYAVFITIRHMLMLMLLITLITMLRLPLIFRDGRALLITAAIIIISTTNFTTPHHHHHRFPSRPRHRRCESGGSAGGVCKSGAGDKVCAAVCACVRVRVEVRCGSARRQRHRVRGRCRQAEQRRCGAESVVRGARAGALRWKMRCVRAKDI